MDINKHIVDLQERMLELTSLYGTPNNNQKRNLWNSFNKLKEAINYSQCCTEFKTEKEKDTFDEGYRKGWTVGASVE